MRCALRAAHGFDRRRYGWLTLPVKKLCYEVFPQEHFITFTTANG